MDTDNRTSDTARTVENDDEVVLLRQQLAELTRRNAELEQDKTLLQQKVADITQEWDTIRHERDRFHYVLQNSPVAVRINRGPDLVLEFANAPYLAIIGRPASVIGLPFREILPEITGQGYFEIMDEIYRTETPFIGTEMPISLDRNGTGRLENGFFDLTYKPLLVDGRIEGVFAFAVDVTAQVKSRQALEHEQHRLEHLFMQAPAAIAILRGPTHVFELANTLYERLVGQDRLLVGNSIREAFPDLAGQGIYELLDTVYRSGKAVVGDEVMLRLDRANDGNIEEGYFSFVYQPLFAPDGTIEGIFVLVSDVTDQVVARQAAQRLTAEMEAVIESIPEALFIGDATGIHRANPQALAMAGISNVTDRAITMQTLAETMRVRSVETGEPTNALDDCFARSLAGELCGTECTVYDAQQAQDVIVRVQTAPIKYQDRAIGVLAIAADITESKKVQAALQALNQQKDEFLSIVSHDLRTPITSIKGYAQLLERSLRRQLAQSRNEQADTLAPEFGPEQTGLREKNVQTIGAIVRQSNRMTELVNGLLDFSRIQANQLTLNYSSDANLVDLVRTVVAHLSMTTADHTLSIDLTPESDIRVSYDEARVEQVLTNLIGNAIKYSPGGTTVTVGVEMRSQAQHGITTGAEAVVWVRDEGTGISVEQQTHLFERFYRAPNALVAQGGGLGLGLYISREIVAQHNGRLWVESTPGKGSTFYMALPLAPD